MLIKYSADPLVIENISHSVTLVPRLKYSMNLLDEIIDILISRQSDLKNANRFLICDFDESDKTHLNAVRLEYSIVLALDTLQQIKKSMTGISNVGRIPDILTPFIPVIRAVSAQLFGVVPACSPKLSEISVHLGSIVLDSAALTAASFDFSHSNTRSSTLLDKVKLMAGSKLNKRYPNVDFSKLCIT